jgi:ribosome biogenesis GTPase
VNQVIPNYGVIEELRLGLGRVVRAVGGFFYVEADENPSGHTECSVRGRMKVTDESISVGDRVTLTIENGQAVITGIVNRETLLKRPYIANVNLIVLVFACKDPDPNEYLITKFLILAEQTGIPFIVVFNKADLLPVNDVNRLAEKYRNYGYEVFITSVVMRHNREELLQKLNGKITVFSGPSGVGKSALLNMVAPGFELKTGAISHKIRRGKHTTREVQLLRLNGNGYVADTPGFTQITLDDIAPNDLKNFFPDFAAIGSDCRFDGCIHQAEPDCGIKKAVAAGQISAERYQAYLSILTEVAKNWRRRYR